MSVGRLVERGLIGGLFIGHGTQKLFGWFGGPGRAGTEGMMTAMQMHPAKVNALAAGVTVGLLTGFFGVGGGFLVVPMLALAMRFPLRRAIGTSLVIVGFVSLAGLGAHLARDADLDTGVAAAMAVSCAAGAAPPTADRRVRRRPEALAQPAALRSGRTATGAAT